MIAKPKPAKFHVAIGYDYLSPSDKFIGVCVLCGQANLTVADIRRECANPQQLSYERIISLIRNGEEP